MQWTLGSPKVLCFFVGVPKATDDFPAGLRVCLGQVHLSLNVLDLSPSMKYCSGCLRPVIDGSSAVRESAG